MHPFHLVWLWLTSPEYRLMRRAYQAIQKNQERLSDGDATDEPLDYTTRRSWHGALSREVQREEDTASPLAE